VSALGASVDHNATKRGPRRWRRVDVRSEMERQVRNISIWTRVAPARPSSARP